MSDSDKKFVGAIPDIYDQYLVPLIFERHADDLAERMAGFAPKDILETAAGSGVVTRAAFKQLSDDARYVVTDLNAPMLDRARSTLPDDPRLSWQASDALSLDFPDAQFDLILCQFGVMFYPDRVKGNAEAHRVLRDGGRYIFNVWDHIGVNEFADEVTNALAEIYPDDPPAFLDRTPHGYYDLDLIRADLTAAGFSDIKIDMKTDVSHAAHHTHPAIAYCQGTPLRNELEARDPARLQEATDHAAAAIKKRFGDGAVQSKIQGYVVTATK